MGFNQGPAVGLRAWHGWATMAHFKDVGLGQGQAWVALLEREGLPGQREGETDWEKEMERESSGPQESLPQTITGQYGPH